VQVKTKNLMVGALIALLVLVLFYRMVYGSMESQASKAKQHEKDYNAQINTLQHQLKAIAPGVSNAPTKGVSKDELAAAVPPAADEGEFIRIFDEIRDASGVKFQQITPSAPSAGATGGASAPAGVQTINVGITVQGTYGQVQDYVDRLMKAPRLMVIDSENVTAGSRADGSSSAGGAPVGPVFAGQGGPPLLQVQLTARLFTLAAPVAAAGATGTHAGSTPAAPTGGSGVQNS